MWEATHHLILILFLFFKLFLFILFSLLISQWFNPLSSEVLFMIADGGDTNMGKGHGVKLFSFIFVPYLLIITKCRVRYFARFAGIGRMTRE